MSRVYLVDRDNPFASPARFLDAEEAYRHLQRAALEHDNLQHFRQVFHQVNLGGGAQPPSDRRVLAGLAERLASGALAISGARRPVVEPRRQTGAGAAPPPPAAPEAPSLPGAPPALKLRPPPVPQVPQLPEAVTDYLQQAQCLVDAAQSGAAFVEQCAK